MSILIHACMGWCMNAWMTNKLMWYILYWIHEYTKTCMHAFNTIGLVRCRHVCMHTFRCECASVYASCVCMHVCACVSDCIHCIWHACVCEWMHVCRWVHDLMYGWQYIINECMHVWMNALINEISHTLMITRLTYLQTWCMHAHIYHCPTW